MEPLSRKKRRIYFYTFSLVFLIVIPIVILYAQGFRFTRNWQILETGGVYVTSNESESRVYIGGELEKITGVLTRGVFKQNLKPGHYSVEVGKVGYFPSVADIVVRENFVTEFDALLIPVVPTFVSLEKRTSTYAGVSSLFEGKVSTTTTNILLQNAVVKSVSQGKEVSSIFNYPGRTDALVFALGGGVFVVQPTDERNIFPLYQGKQKVEVRVFGKAIYIKEGDSIVRFEQ